MPYFAHVFDMDGFGPAGKGCLPRWKAMALEQAGARLRQACWRWQHLRPKDDCTDMAVQDPMGPIGFMGPTLSIQPAEAG